MFNGKSKPFFSDTEFQQDNIYHNGPKVLDRQVWTKKGNPDHTTATLFAIQSASFGHIHYSKTILFKYFDNYSNFSSCPNILDFYFNLFLLCCSDNADMIPDLPCFSSIAVTMLI